jgi:hypothetical protein
MNRSKIHVQYGDGSKPKGIGVTLGFTGGLGGHTKKFYFYTDAHGTAIVEHSSAGRADVYVSGTKRGSLTAPGETVVFLS